MKLLKKSGFTKQAIASVLVLSQGISAGAITRPALPTDATREELAQFKKDVRKDGTLLNKVIMMFAKDWNKYSAERGQPGGPDENSDMMTITDYDKVSVRPPTREEMAIARETNDLANKYYANQGESRYIGTFIESGAPWSDGYQWNTHRWQGLLIPAIRDKALDKAAAENIRNVRFGVNTQDIVLGQPETVKPVVDMCVAMWKRGITPTIAVSFFPSLKNLRTFDKNGKIIPEQSYQNHPDFPKYMEQIARLVLSEVKKAQIEFNKQNEKLPKSKRLPRAEYAVDPINEPETDAGFNKFWRDALAEWSDPNQPELYVQTIINEAKAAVRIRLAAEQVANGDPQLYFHNEAMTPPDYPSHHGDGQYAISKFMLGHDVLMKANLDQLKNESLDDIKKRFDQNKAQGNVNEVEWSILAAANVPKNDTPEKKEQARQFVVAQLKQLQDMHHELKAKTGITGRHRTMLMLDYYQQTEFKFNRQTSDLVNDLVKDNGAVLKKILKVEDDAGVLQVLNERVGSAEALTGQPLRQLITGTSEAELRKIFTVEDGVMLDKVIGFRNSWATKPDQVFVARRALLGLKDPELNELSQDSQMRDERRIDPLFNKMLANDNALLKQMLNVSSDDQLRQVLTQNVQADPNQSIRDILNANDRKPLYDILGVTRTRKLGMLPPHFARQSRLDLRNGIYKSTINYINELGLRVGGIGETGTPYVPWAENWHLQAFMEAATAFRKASAYFKRYDLGAMIGAVGWINGPLVKSLKENKERAQDGILKLVYSGTRGEKASTDHFDFALGTFMDKEPWFTTFRNNLMSYFNRAQQELDQEQLTAKKLDDKTANDSSKRDSSRAVEARTCEALFRSRAS